MPMLKRLAPLVPMSFVLLLAACASHSPESQPNQVASVPATRAAFQVNQHNIALMNESQDEGAKNDNGSSTAHVSDILDRAFSLIGTPYRFGGKSERTGFDCSGFVGYLFREEAGISLPRSTREMINMDVPLVSKADLQPGDLIFFNNRGRGRVSHAGIYIGDGQFIHSASRRGGGVRVDSLDESYWRLSYMEAKRVLEPGYEPKTAIR
ncbi:C40 family peptidase [Pseudomonas nicosulfuronedens]|uniref:NlpC/P60 family protein n=1 Tax=Pseudomonas nicosulfuronedens TaxID=2571105 RepID=A0A5R9QNN0_9PSED|nr:C40 family peptidase [Pseudomonas nicosulfuronedens]MDH1011641.1 C40 family peptidase [Pseudomonas nicosulfuronedens]MDH1980370.1 C40 family peptidase [Pseudomonas nicosulfuronedens]MDH2027378.1 C40 family peptidase [Pseudomonas nicosulfuronedens]TLX70977.1 NlpC/P60 family protein [Pseudomonas nicosulfuronedens]